MTTSDPTDDPTVQVARNLRAIVELSADLEDQAVNKATDRELPGGDAMVYLSPVANLEAWGNVVDGAERWNADHQLQIDLSHVEDEHESYEPPLQTLLFWSEAWRVEHGAESDMRPTVATEAGFLTRLLQWAYDNEPHWDDFASDVHAARTRIEATLYAGDRDEKASVCECGIALIHEVEPRSPRPQCQGHGPWTTCPWPRQGCCDRGGLKDEWRCPSCRRVYTPPEYQQLVARDYQDNATALHGDAIEKRCGVTISKVRVWAHRGKVRTRGKDAYGRTLYDVADVLRRAVEAEMVTQ